ncbi:hypothetical protein LAZ67_2003022 [Cordylochernes scorpioides]|uniref:Uncharacterized protein n=1 Tax=Cordylochernes scorpioides TaxID=51811 RepID=A0ABY6K429_9ARAC|nr:hypothetical protein LAZ67_2003022 [Cordylochernes scorpioides]
MDVFQTDHYAVNGVEWHAQTLDDALQTECAELRTWTRTSTYVFPRDAAERDLACTGEGVVVLNSVWMDIKTWWQR